MFILKFFFIFIIAIVLFVVVFIGSIVYRMWDSIRVLMGKEPRTGANSAFKRQWDEAHRQSGANNASSSQTGEVHISGGRQRNSQIDKNEGEYVDYEVIEE